MVRYSASIVRQAGQAFRCSARRARRRPRPMEARIDGARREFQDPRDLLVGQSLDVAEGQDDAILLRQGLDERLDERPAGLGLPFPLGFFGLLAVRDGDLRDVVERNLFRPALLAQEVPDVVDRDPVQPGPELRFPVEPGQGEIGLQEDLLGQVVGRFPVPGEAQCHAEHLGLVLGDELLESRRASFLSQPDQLFLFHADILTYPPHPIRRGEEANLPEIGSQSPTPAKGETNPPSGNKTYYTGFREPRQAGFHPRPAPPRIVGGPDKNVGFGRASLL
jgi:hypothetical protein